MAFVQKANGQGTTTTVSATLTGVSAGNTIVCFAWNGSSITPATHTVSDGQGSYTAQLATPITDSTNNIWLQIYVLQNANAGSHVVTFTGDTGNALEIELIECTAPTTGAVVGTPIGADQANPGTTTDAVSSGTITISQSATLLAMSSDTGNVNAADEPAAGTGFTSRDNNADTTIGSWRLESKSVSSSAAGTFTAVVGGSRFVTAAIAIAEPGGGSSTVTPPVGALTITGAAPTLVRGTIITPSAGSLAITGTQPIMTLTLPAPGSASLTLTGNAPTLVRGTVIVPNVGSLAFGSNSPVVSTSGSSVIQPGAGSLTLTGIAPTTLTNTFITPSAGSLTLNGLAPTVTTIGSVTIQPQAGSLVFNGAVVQLQNSLIKRVGSRRYGHGFGLR